MSKFLHTATCANNDDAKAIEIPRLFSKNSRVKNKYNYETVAAFSLLKRPILLTL